MLKNTIIVVKDFRWLLDFFSVTDLTVKLNGPNTELQGENKIIVKMIGATDSLKGKLRLWKTQLMKGVLTHFPSVQYRTGGTFHASICIMGYTDTPLKEYERRFKDSGRMEFTVSFIANRFEREILSRALNSCPLCSRKMWAN
jgi:hypothetical protein